MASINDNIINSIDTIVVGALKDQKYDITIKATVLEPLGNNKYSCKYESAVFTAIGPDGEYEEDDNVYVLVPQNNWKLDKHIVFKVEKDTVEDLDPFKNFLNVNNGSPDVYIPDKVGIIPNYYQEQGKGSTYFYPLGGDTPEAPGDGQDKEYKLFDLSKQDEPFTRMGVKMQFSTNHVASQFDDKGWSLIGGNYGLWIKIYQSGSEEDATIFTLDTSDMLGNVYTAEGWYEYEKVFDISKLTINEDTCIKFLLMEDGNFIYYDEDLNVQYFQNPPEGETETKQIKAKNMNLYFGYSTSDFYDGQIQLICDDDMRYDDSWKKDDTKKDRLKKKLKWYLYEKQKGQMVRKKIPVTSDRDNYVKVYYSKGGSGDFKEVAKINPPKTSTTIVIKDTAEEKLEYKIKYWQKNLTFENGNNSPYISRESNIITFYRLTVPTVEVEMPDLSNKLDTVQPVGSGGILIGDGNLAVGLENAGGNNVLTGSQNRVGQQIAEVVNSKEESVVESGYVCIKLDTNPRNHLYDIYYKNDDIWELRIQNATLQYPQAEEVIQLLSTMVAGDANLILNDYAFASGQNNQAGGECSHAEGSGVKAVGNSSHAEGFNTRTFGDCSHAEGNWTKAEGQNSHAEGRETEAIGEDSHAEGYSTIAEGYRAHAEGYDTSATGSYSHAEGYDTVSGNNGSHAEGQSTEASGIASHAEGNSTKALKLGCHAEGCNTVATVTQSSSYFYIFGGAHAEGSDTIANGHGAHAEGFGTRAEGHCQHVFGHWNEAYNAPGATPSIVPELGEPTGFVEIVGGGFKEKVELPPPGSGEQYTREVYQDIRRLDWRGNEYLKGTLYLDGIDIKNMIGAKASINSVMTNNNPTGSGSLKMNPAIGSSNYGTTILGYNNMAYGAQSQAEGFNTMAYGACLRASGQFNEPDFSAPNYNKNVIYHRGDIMFYSDTFWRCLIDMTEPEEWNVEHWIQIHDMHTYLEIVGNGNGTSGDPHERSNARTLDWNGNEVLAGDLTINKSTTPIIVSERLLPEPPAANGTQTLQCTVNNGVVSYQWV